MDLKAKVASVLSKYDIKNGDSFTCTSYGNPKFKIEYTLMNGIVRGKSGRKAGATEVKNMLAYYIIKKI